MDKMTRRGFLGGALAAAAAVSASAADGAGPRPAGPAPAFGFGLGLASYTFREFDLDATLAMARRAGLVPDRPEGRSSAARQPGRSRSGRRRPRSGRPGPRPLRLRRRLHDERSRGRPGLRLRPVRRHGAS
ncbi:MAG: hypothetical protein MZV49_00065 [Rhodopseudomonas palustris]|nr:hypothetical protein [Rhodopseudomonas palustris]